MGIKLGGKTCKPPTEFFDTLVFTNKTEHNTLMITEAEEPGPPIPPTVPYDPATATPPRELPPLRQRTYTTPSPATTVPFEEDRDDLLQDVTIPSPPQHPPPPAAPSEEPPLPPPSTQPHCSDDSFLPDYVGTTVGFIYQSTGWVTGIHPDMQTVYIKEVSTGITRAVSAGEFWKIKDIPEFDPKIFDQARKGSMRQSQSAQSDESPVRTQEASSSSSDVCSKGSIPESGKDEPMIATSEKVRIANPRSTCLNCGLTSAQSKEKICMECKGPLKEALVLSSLPKVQKKLQSVEEGDATVIQSMLGMSAAPIPALLARNKRIGIPQLDDFEANFLDLPCTAEINPILALHRAGKCTPCPRRICNADDCDYCHEPHPERRDEAYDKLMSKLKRKSPNAESTDQTDSPLIDLDTPDRTSKDGCDQLIPDHDEPIPIEYESVMACFEWEEDVVTTTSTLERHEVFSHSTAQLIGEEGLLVDTGAVNNVSGMEFIKRQTKASEQYGYHTTWEQLDKVQHMSGVGDNTKMCTHQATITGILSTGELMQYSAPVIPGNPSPVPPLYGLKSMAKENTFVGTRQGNLAMVPDGKEEEIVWPKGTRFIQMKKAPSGHWLIPISNWTVKVQKKPMAVFHLNPQD